MALDPELVAMATTSVTVRALVGHSAHGAPLHASSSAAAGPFPARVEMGPRVLFGVAGVQEIGAGTLFVLSTGAQIGAQDLIEHPALASARTVRVDPVDDEDGLHHWEIIFG